MTSLWIILTIMVLLALLFVVIPVWRFRGEEKAEDIDVRKRTNSEAFRQSLQELDQDLANQFIDQAQYDKLKAELERGYLRDMEQLENYRMKTLSLRHNKLIPVAVALLVPVFSITLYLNMGSARDLVLPRLMERIQSSQTAEEQEAALTDLADFLQARFERLPENVQNGYMLGTLYLRLERYDEAVETFEELVQVTTEAEGNQATVLGQLAQAQYLAAGREITPEVRETMDRAIALNPNEYAVMSILAIDSFMKQDYAEAVNYWQRQLSQVTPGSSEAQSLQQRINRVQELIPEDQREETSVATNETQQGGAAGDISIDVRVDVADSIRDQVGDDMQVFVYARRPEMPMPLAAERHTVADLPLSLTLDDSDAMMQGLNLSSAQTVIVGARISQSGGAVAQTGDFQALSDPVELGERDEPVMLVIEDVVQ